MKALKKKTKIVVIIAAIAIAALITVVVFYLPELIAPLLWTLLILGVGFLLIDFWFRLKKKKNQEDFDEKVSAKEGIEDRKREWASWTEELNRQGIDRYELPYYLIVGEPQSGKSVLLQNSDLYFPFGQERLSGVGGTRGCDWWFTDEAVILDIAGRLFTHEGGVADKLEWEAFLDLLNSFRPLCPANGVLLVIPCDALLEDSPEECAEKANKIQSAMLTLSQKLQAQLPVYLVLTKGDKIFGFAESVHRLDANERHEMFGWSRDPDRAEHSFALDEAKAGFAVLVDRARLLRERMVASARLPEALPEVDRLYAFPDELNGLYGALEIYLKRIFTESSLVERMTFRGIYLTSGLQTGVPVARVCADLLGGDDRESDARGLESLFSHQRAYFIKDLVRNRVFAERGLVRPTEGRVLAARRNAVLGYGAAGLLAAAAIVGATIHLMSARSGDVEATFKTALTSARNAATREEIPALLRELHAVDDAVQVDRDLMREVFRSTRDGFEQLYTKICTRKLVPTLRRRLEEKLLAKANRGPSSYDDFTRLMDIATPLFDDIDFGDEKIMTLVTNELGAEAMTSVTASDGSQTNFTLAEALEKSGGELTSSVQSGSRNQLEELAQRLLVLLDDAIDPATSWMSRGHLGYMIAWNGAKDAFAKLKKPKPDAELLQNCDVFANAVSNLSAMVDGPALAEGKVTNSEFKSERGKLGNKWVVLDRFLHPESEKKWPKLTALDVFAREVFENCQTGDPLPTFSPVSGLAGRYVTLYQQDQFGNGLASFEVPVGEVLAWTEDAGHELAACVAEPHADWKLASVVDALEANDSRPGSLYNIKVQAMAAQMSARYPNWAAAAEEFHREREAPAADTLDQKLVDVVARVRRALARYGLDDSPAAERLSRLLGEHLSNLDEAWSKRTDWGSSIDWSIAGTLSALASNDAIGSIASGLADQLRWQYVNQHEQRLAQDWSGRDDDENGTKDTLEIAAALNEHLAKLEDLAQRGDGESTAPLSHPDHSAWLENIDTLLSGRLAKHVESLAAYWRPNTSAWSDLDATVAGIKEALAAQAVSSKIRGVKKSVDAPDPRAPEFRAGTPLDTTDALPKSAAALVSLRGFVQASESSIRNHDLAQWILANIGKIERELRPNGGRALATIAVEMAPAPVAIEGMKTEDHYVRPLYSALRERLVAAVRSRYVRALAETVLERDTRLLDALYAKTPATISAIDDQVVIPRLAELLNPGGKLDALRRGYRMQPDPDGGTPDLRPAETSTAAAREGEWWTFERFLVDLQSFLVSGEGERVGSAQFRVRYERPRSSAGGVWDLRDKPFCYYATSWKNKGAPGYIQLADDWDRMQTPLEWQFSDSAKPTLWFVWTAVARTRKFQWPSDTNKTNDLWFELNGSLAPLLLAWSGKEGTGWWRVDIEPANSDEKAGLHLSFLAAGDAELRLPPRPVTTPSAF